MAVITLPDWPGPASMTPHPISARNELRPTYGGPTNRLNRPGTRWAWDFVMPPLTYVESLAWDGLLSESDVVRWDLLQPDLEIGTPGLPVVNGAGQLGMTLNIRAGRPHYSGQLGQWCSLEIDGQSYAYKLSGPALLDGSGAAALPLRTMIRRPPADGAVVHLGAPIIEGFATVDPGSLEVDNDGLVRLKFTIEERE